jgi:hypothetical protein
MCLRYKIKAIIDTIDTCDLCVNRKLKAYEEPCLSCYDEMRGLVDFKYAPDAFVTIGSELNNYVYDNFKDDVVEE